MTRAARSLHVAQPAVSKTIRQPGKRTGRALVRAHGQGLRRTPQGDILLRYARDILRAEQDARHEIEESLHHAGSLCICALSCSGRLGDILAGFAAAHGPADLRIAGAPEGSDLLLDSAVSLDGVPESAELLCEEEICLAVPAGHRLAGRGTVSLTELADDPFIALSHSHSFEQVSAYIFQSAGMTCTLRSSATAPRCSSSCSPAAWVWPWLPPETWQQADNTVRLLHIRDTQCRRYIYMQVLSRFSNTAAAPVPGLSARLVCRGSADLERHLIAVVEPRRRLSSEQRTMSNTA